MARTLPKAVKVWVAANLLAIEFDNGQTRYMRSLDCNNKVTT